ncbi:hypothetical protein HRG_007522 [Hirsutella rhossiliensis]|uniref:M6 family metalloprotease domain-containing protein n=1 Tax=Hirsutella rhossiliensis TaxID=111463 RepID=A0A9P8SGT7_9HYPO|nr:uncharacterized protein HRG_07522 [Hirsutella rhossiliensis]KAH0961444.1 hypothetical protein HRG_07522 [Hirsutella rhossiliensis]
MAFVVTAVLLAAVGEAAASRPLRVTNPFEVVDEQRWVNPDNMTWADFKAPPGTAWNDSSRRGSIRNFNIALIAVDYQDKAFAITGPPNSTLFGNPLPVAANTARARVPAFYRDLLNKPSELNRGHTLHEYWMEDSGGRFGVNLTAFGTYRMPFFSYQYGVDRVMNPGACPPGMSCDMSLREDSLGVWRRNVGDDVADSYELVFILSAGQDESSTWQEFGEMKFATKEDVPAAWGPPLASGEQPSLPNYAHTRYVEWTSWAAAASIWPNAGDGSSLQCESSGMGTYAHELSHLLNIGDNYGNPYGKPLRRDYTGPWSMLSRGTFNGPGGPHTRWQIPPLQGGSMGSLHTVRDKYQLKLVAESSLRKISRNALAASGPVVARITARAVESDLMGLRVEMGTDLSPRCDVATDLFCDGGGYDNYDVEVVDRMGADSFQPDSGVMISKTKNTDRRQPFQWTIDANPHDINLADFIRPNGTVAMATMGDYRQLADALFHAGTRSGSQYEFVDAPNGLHFYVVDKHRDRAGVLSYTVGVRALNGTAKGQGGVRLSPGKPAVGEGNRPTGKGVFCAFGLTNNGTAREKHRKAPRQAAPSLGADIYRLHAKVEGKGWRVEVRNALAAAKAGETVGVKVAVGASADAAKTGIVTLTAVSESDSKVKAEARCQVSKG